ncbi:RagB/SusD family nutrient uptake outer membrane protein [Sphingobacterium sp. E70]|uniref:RagB/SusD family nutrient uptake outer membrane protein n=1 Tax=Sphingobacterium sp. E70 TaxID=2853439 RepID=UPI00211BEB2A|nr:RagB/SusD family nutrient uptake outer membrane protein [Sphingobacterium sp. E70]
MSSHTYGIKIQWDNPRRRRIDRAGFGQKWCPLNTVKNIIAHERFVEFLGEYQRYFDLLRWGWPIQAGWNP